MISSVVPTLGMKSGKSWEYYEKIDWVDFDDLEDPDDFLVALNEMLREDEKESERKRALRLSQKREKAVREREEQKRTYSGVVSGLKNDQLSRTKIVPSFKKDYSSIGLYNPPIVSMTAEIMPTDDVSLTINIEDKNVDKSLVKMLSLKGSYTLDLLKKIPHEFAAMTLMGGKIGQSDASMKDMGGCTLTPDYRKGNEWILEVGTNAKSSEVAYQVKIGKYTHTLRQKGYKGAILVCGISSDKITANIELSEKVVREVLWAYNLGNIVKNKLINEFSIPIDATDFSSEKIIEREIKKMAEEFKVKYKTHDFKLVITEEMIKAWRSTERANFKKMLFNEIKDKMRELVSKTVKETPIEDVRKILDDYEDKRRNLKWMSEKGVELEKKKSFSTFLKSFPVVMNDRGLLPSIGDLKTKSPVGKLFRTGLAMKGFLPDVVKSALDYSTLKALGYITSANNLTKSQLGYFKESSLDPSNLEPSEHYDPNQYQHLKSAVRDRGAAMRFEVGFDTLTVEEKYLLAQRAIESKMFKEDPRMTKRKEEQSIPYDWDLDSSVGDSLFNYDWYSYVEGQSINSPEYIRLMKDHIKQRDVKYSEEEMTEFGNTKLCKMMYANDRIFEEVCISLHSYTSSGQYLIKKIRGTNTYILVKCISVSKGIRFAILHPKIDVLDVPNKTMIKLEDYDENFCISDFYSIERHRISHHLGNSFTMFATWSYLKDIFMDRNDIKNSKIHFFKTNSWKHLVAQSILSMSTKPNLIISGLLMRYSYGEACAQTLQQREPYKILTKLPTIIRDPVVMWFQKRMFEAIKRMSLSPPKMYTDKRDQEDTTEDLENLESDRRAASIRTRYKGVISWMTLTEIMDLDQILYASYSCVFHNPNEGDTNQASHTIYAKIINQEIKLYDPKADWDWCGWKSEGNRGKPHSFRVDLVKEIGIVSRDYLDQKSGSSFMKIFRKRLSQETSRIDFSDIATFKASAVRQKNVNFLDYSVQKSMNKRIKCLEATINLMTRTDLGSKVSFRSILQAARSSDQSMNLSSRDLDELLTKLNSGLPMTEEREKEIVELLALEHIISNKIMNGKPLENLFEIYSVIKEEGVFSNLFKKQQLTGLREIFVFDIYSRVCILFLETCSRIVCENLPTEMLTKGSEKVSIIRNYIIAFSKKKTEGKYLRSIFCNDADDKTNWCQQFVMPLFGCMWYGFMQKDIEGPSEDKEFCDDLLRTLCSILNLVTYKKLELPKKLLQEYSNYTERKNFDSGMNELKDQFLGRNERRTLINPHEIVMNNFSNMMQGALHFTSSMLHGMFSLFMIIVMKVIHLIIETVINKTNGRNCVKINDDHWSVSSDDSLVLRTALFNKDSIKIGENQVNTKEFLSLYFTSVSLVCRVWSQDCCMTHSYEKSTGPNFSGVSEFNSFWMIMHSLVVPGIKYVYAATKPKVTNSLIDRSRTWVELQKQCIENCVKSDTVHVVALSQMFNHYHCLGMRSSEWFDGYMEEILKCRCPEVGYFLMPPRLCAGLTSFDYLYFMNMKDHPNALKAFCNMRLSDNKFEIDEKGKPTIRVNINIGSKEKWLRAVRDFMPPIDYEYVVLSRPSFLVTGPTNPLESLYLIWDKLLNPSSSEAYSYTDTYKTMSSSCYVLQTACVQVQRKETNKWDKTWLSLIGVSAYINQMESQQVDPDAVQRLKDMTFTESYFYNSMEKVIDECYDYLEIETSEKMVQRKMDFSIPVSQFGQRVSIRDCLCYYWEDGKFKPSKTKAEVDVALPYYQVIYPWLFVEGRLKTFSELIRDKQNFPFSGVGNFRSFLQSFEKRYTVITPITSARNSFSLDEKFRNLVCYTRSNNYYLQKQRKERKTDVLREDLRENFVVIERYSATFKALTDFDLKGLKQLLISNNLSLSDKEYHESNFLNERDQSDGVILRVLSTMQSTLLTVEQKLFVLRECKKIPNKTYIGYIKPQSRNERGEWVGRGVFLVLHREKEYKLHVNNDKIVLIETGTLRDISKSMNYLKLAIRRLKLSTHQDDVIGHNKNDFWVNFHGSGDRIMSKKADLHACPVRLDKELGIGNVLSEDMYIEIIPFERVVIFTRLHEARLSIFSHYFNSPDYLTREISGDFDEIDLNIMNGKEIPKDVFSKMLMNQDNKNILEFLSNLAEERDKFIADREIQSGSYLSSKEELEQLEKDIYRLEEHKRSLNRLMTELKMKRNILLTDKSRNLAETEILIKEVEKKSTELEITTLTKQKNELKGVVNSLKLKKFDVSWSLERQRILSDKQEEMRQIFLNNLMMNCCLLRGSKNLNQGYFLKYVIKTIKLFYNCLEIEVQEDYYSEEKRDLDMSDEVFLSLNDDVSALESMIEEDEYFEFSVDCITLGCDVDWEEDQVMMYIRLIKSVSNILELESIIQNDPSSEMTMVVMSKINDIKNRLKNANSGVVQTIEDMDEEETLELMELNSIFEGMNVDENEFLELECIFSTNLKTIQANFSNQLESLRTSLINCLNQQNCDFMTSIMIEGDIIRINSENLNASQKIILKVFRMGREIIDENKIEF